MRAYAYAAAYRERRADMTGILYHQRQFKFIIRDNLGSPLFSLSFHAFDIVRLFQKSR